MKKLIIFFWCSSCLAQTRNPALDINRANIWHFGWESVSLANDAPSLHFDSITPYVLNIGPGGTVATACDSLGTLQIYGGSYRLYNKNHAWVAGSPGPIGDSLPFSQHAVAVPKPKDPNLIYYFTVPLSLKYNLVDMSLDGGNGKIIEYNVTVYPFPPGVGSKIAAVHHCNGSDVWVMVQELYTDSFLAFLVTDTGINTTPVISEIGPSANEFGSAEQGGVIKFSPNGKRMAVTYKGARNHPQVFDFDNSTGVLSNPIALQKDVADQGLSFSPDNSKLYIGTHEFLLLQYDLQAGDSAAIATSRKVIENSLPAVYPYMQIGRDAKIYLGVYTNISDYIRHVGVINNPNALGTLCDFNPRGIYLNGARLHIAGMMNTVESYYYTGTSAFPCYGDTNIINSVSNFAEGFCAWVYPNPFMDKALIEISSVQPITIKGRIDYLLFDALGREYKINYSEVNRDAYSVRIVLNKGRLNSGIYFLTVKTFNTSVTIKLSLL